MSKTTCGRASRWKGLRAFRGHVDQYGMCNACPVSLKTTKVWVIQMNRLEIRLCSSCRNELVRQTQHRRKALEQENG